MVLLLAQDVVEGVPDVPLRTDRRDVGGREANPRVARLLNRDLDATGVLSGLARPNRNQGMQVGGDDSER